MFTSVKLLTRFFLFQSSSSFSSSFDTSLTLSLLQRSYRALKARMQNTQWNASGEISCGILNRTERGDSLLSDGAAQIISFFFPFVCPCLSLWASVCKCEWIRLNCGLSVAAAKSICMQTFIGFSLCVSDHRCGRAHSRCSSSFRI